MIDFKTKRGSMIVEAAIMMPVFVIIVVTFCWLIKACFLEIAVYDTVENEVKKFSVISTAPTQSQIRSALDAIHVAGEDYDTKMVLPASVEGISGFTKISFDYDTKINVPIPAVNNIFLKNEIIYRNWSGYRNPGIPFGFDAMEMNGSGAAVYVFPMAGEKYHNRGCRVTKSYSETMTLSSAVRKKYGACPLCSAGRASDGQTVYVFKYGACYHLGSCDAVTKFIILMDQADALSKGYTACSVCGG